MLKDTANRGVKRQGRVRTLSCREGLCETSELAGAALRPPEPRVMVPPCPGNALHAAFYLMAENPPTSFTSGDTGLAGPWREGLKIACC